MLAKLSATSISSLPDKINEVIQQQAAKLAASASVSMSVFNLNRSDYKCQKNTADDDDDIRFIDSLCNVNQQQQQQQQQQKPDSKIISMLPSYAISSERQLTDEQETLLAANCVCDAPNIILNTTINNDSTSDNKNRPMSFSIEWRDLSYYWEPSYMDMINGTTKWANRNKTKKLLLRSLDGSFKSGELSGILGPSGAGKSTFIDCLFGKKQDTALGETRVQWYDTTTTTDNLKLNYRRCLNVAIVPQDDHLLDHLSVLESLMFASKIKNRSMRENNNYNYHRNNVQRVVDQLQLNDCLSTRCNKLSGGQYKRVSIAQELLSNPDVIILDEPTSGLDALTCYNTVLTLKRLIKTLPIAIILTIHQPDTDVFSLFDHVYVIAQGGLAIYDGPPDKLTERMASVGLSVPKHYNPARFVVENAFLTRTPLSTTTTTTTSCLDQFQSSRQNEIAPFNAPQSGRCILKELNYLQKLQYTTTTNHHQHNLPSILCNNGKKLKNDEIDSVSKGSAFNQSNDDYNHSDYASLRLVATPTSDKTPTPSTNDEQKYPSAVICSGVGTSSSMSSSSSSSSSASTSSHDSCLSSTNNNNNNNNTVDFDVKLATATGQQQLTGGDNEHHASLSLLSNFVDTASETTSQQETNLTKFTNNNNERNQEEPHWYTHNSKQIELAARNFDKCLSAKYICSKRQYDTCYHAYQLSYRTWLSKMRDPVFFGIQLAMHTCIPIMLALIFGKTSDDGCPQLSGFDLVDFAYTNENDLISSALFSIRNSISNIGIIFLETFVLCFAINCITALVFPSDMHVLIKEYRNGWYNSLSYFIARTLVDLPIPLIMHTMAMMILYYATGQPYSYLEWRFFTLNALVILASLIAQSCGLIIGALLMKSPQSAVLLAAAIVAPIFALSGFVTRLHNLTWLPRILAQLFSYLYHLLNGFIVTRYGFNMCPCYEEDFSINSEHRVPDNLKTTASIWIGTFSNEYLNDTDLQRFAQQHNRTTTNVDPNIDLVDKMLNALTKAKTFGQDMRDCSQVAPYAMIEFNLKDSDLWYSFAALALMLLVVRTITFITIYFKIRARV